MKCKKKDCKYRGKFHHDDNSGYCDYITHTGHSRGCPVESCDKYEPVEGPRKRRVSCYGSK